MKEDTEDRYRRKEDEGPRLLILLSERVANLKKAVETLIDKQEDNPCKVNSLRLRTLEKVMWLVASGVILLIAKIMYDVICN